MRRTSSDIMIRMFNAKLGRDTFGLSESELKIFKRLSSPIKIQDFLDTLAINWEKDGETAMSPRSVLRERKAHCFEGALVAVLALWLHGEEPVLLDLRTPGEPGHSLALYKRNGYWGAISKTNHAALRFRDPVYANIRELVMSYFHECWNDDTKKKGLRGYVGPLYFKSRLKAWGTGWAISDEAANAIAESNCYLETKRLWPERIWRKNVRYVRKPDKMESLTGTMIEWDKSDPRT